MVCTHTASHNTWGSFFDSFFSTGTDNGRVDRLRIYTRTGDKGSHCVHVMRVVCIKLKGSGGHQGVTK